MKRLTRMLALLTIMGWVGSANAVIVWSEGVDGDLGGATSTSIGSLGVGVFDVIGSMTTIRDQDYFNWTLVGSKLDSVSLFQWDSSSPQDIFAVRVSDSASTAAKESEFKLGNTSSLGQDLYNLAGVSKSGAQFSSGTRTGTFTVNYGFRITTVSAQAVPSPATAVLFGLGLASLGWSRRKKA